ncbi:class I SAM-dependent methyltransferase, partial [Candidatus Thioglobus sp.]|nr:class I SAM-dependent methyltransferase [Candidatus Thioglobus sp.]
LNVSKSIITHFYPWKNLSFINKDMLDLNMDSEFDFIVMGEVLEHVEDPESLLVKISKLLSKNGRAFLSTCVNCPAIDHVYHFHTVDEIRSMFKNCGLVIESEKILPVEEAPMAEIINQKITINYSTIVRRDFE